MKDQPTKEKRKIIQIAMESAYDDDCTPALYALCDDGTLWFGYYDQDGTWQDWQRMNDIPQD